MNAELAILGGLLLDERKWKEVRTKVKEDMFTTDERKSLWRILAKLKDKGKPLDLLLISEEAGKNGGLKQYGGADGLMKLIDQVPTASNINHYIGIVQDKFYRNEIVKEAKKIQEAAESGDQNKINREIEKAGHTFKELNAHSVGIEFDLGKVVDRAIERATDRSELMKTGFPRLDKKLGGLQKRETVIIAGRTGNMKTTFACNLSNNLISMGHKVMIISLEVPGDMYFRKMICAANNINTNKIRNYKYTEEQLEKFSKLCKSFEEQVSDRLCILDKGDGILKDTSLLERSIYEYKPDAVVIDFIQSLPTTKHYRRQETEDYTKWLHGIAEDIDCSMIVVSQITRMSSKYDKGPKYPKLHHLKESGGLEENADAVIILAYPYSDTHEREDKHRLHVDIAKSRYGSLGNMWFYTKPHKNQITDLGKNKFTPKGELIP